MAGVIAGGSLDTPARILVVDDDVGTSATFRAILSRAGYRVETAATGAEALGLVREPNCDLVLLDLRMPGMDGLEFLRRLRATPARPDVVVVSAYADLEDAAEAGRLGVLTVLRKPLRRQELLAHVEAALALRGDPLIAYVRRHFAAIASREQVARHFHIDPGTVCARVKRRTGQTFHAFLLGCRISEAERLLAFTDLNTAQIAARVGCSSRQAFERAFRRHCSVSPGAYRVQRRAGTPSDRSTPPQSP